MALNEEFSSVERLSSDLRKAAATLSDREARFLVDQYYSFQEDRLRAMGRIRAMTADGEPHEVIKWVATQSEVLERQIKGALDRYSQAHPIGRWARAQVGVGPVISAGLIANIDITKANTAGKLWRYCGLAPGHDRRVRGQKLEFNPTLKRLSWIVGESFKKFSGHEDCFYGQAYKRRKEYEVGKNERGEYAEQAKAALTAKKFRDDTVAKAFYEKGQLPPGRIDLRACRWATKLFLAHLQEVWYQHHYGTPPPLPYAIAQMGHADRIPPPP
jgi:hypothetical protein